MAAFTPGQIALLGTPPTNNSGSTVQGAALVRRRRKRWAPGPSAKIDWSHPLSAGLAFLFVAGSANKNLVDGGAPTNVGTSPTFTTIGPATTFASGGYLDFGTNYATSGPFTVAAVVTIAGASTAAIITRQGPGSDPYDQNYFLGQNGGSNLSFGFKQAAGGYPYIVSPTLAVGTYFAVAVWDGTANLLYVDGALVATRAATAPMASAMTFQLGAAEGSSRNFPFSGGISQALMTNRAWSASDAAQFYADPFCMLKAPTYASGLLSSNASSGSRLTVSSGFMA